MTRKRYYLIAAAALAACVGILIGVLAMLPASPGVTKANFDRVEEGMTREEVNAILGEPTYYANTRSWDHADGSYCQVHFADEKVTSTMIIPADETLSEKLRRWLNLPK
jgi:outer membrane protein assembly factor BamE (lipoprotein component of BamABCDE complex)